MEEIVVPNGMPADADPQVPTIPVAAPVAGSAEWKIPVYAIHSQQDEIVPYSAAKQHTAAVQSKGGKVELKTVSGLTHYDSPAYAPHVGEGVKWLQEQWK